VYTRTVKAGRGEKKGFCSPPFISLTKKYFTKEVLEGF